MRRAQLAAAAIVAAVGVAGSGCARADPNHDVHSARCAVGFLNVGGRTQSPTGGEWGSGTGDLLAATSAYHLGRLSKLSPDERLARVRAAARWFGHAPEAFSTIAVECDRERADVIVGLGNAAPASLPTGDDLTDARCFMRAAATLAVLGAGQVPALAGAQPEQRTARLTMSFAAGALAAAFPAARWQADLARAGTVELARARRETGECASRYSADWMPMLKAAGDAIH